jgi:lipoprotein-anchoring transpeptidase ErfK/SrfK
MPSVGRDQYPHEQRALRAIDSQWRTFGYGYFMRVTSWTGKRSFWPLGGVFPAPHDMLTKYFLTVTKPFCGFDANVLKPPPCTDRPNRAPKWRQGAQTDLRQGTTMFNPDALKRNSRRAAFGALASVAMAFSGAASAAPLQLFPFILTPAPMAQPQVQAAPTEDEDTVTELPARLKRQVVSYASREAPGTIIIDTPNTYLYYVLGGGQAIRYGIGVGRDGFTWSGVQSVTRKAEWPDWTPPPEMIARQPYLPRHMAGGPGNPLGARAMYLGGTVYRIHGTNAPGTIGTHVSSGCIRLTNEDVTDLYSRVNVGTKVIVLPMDRRADNTDGRRS